MILTFLEKIKPLLFLILLIFCGVLNANINAATDSLSELRQKKSSKKSFSPPVEAGTRDSGRENLLKSVVNRYMPMTSDEIIRLKKELRSTEIAAASPIAVPQATISTKFVDLAPGSTPPIVRMARSFVSVINFVDSTGAPWPIVSLNLADPGSFTPQVVPGSNSIIIQAKKTLSYSNIAVVLKDLSTPIVLTLVSGQRNIDYRLDLHIERSGPNAKKMVAPPESPNNLLISFLNETPPEKAVVLQIDRPGIAAWKYQGKMFLRTNLNLLSPAWLNQISSSDGTHLYELEVVSELVFSRNGKLETISVQI